jgi:RES domain-containing protein
MASAASAVRLLPKLRRLYRIGDADGEYPVWHSGGSLRNPGRWNLEGEPVIYAAESYALAMLEKLVHWNGIVPSNQHFVEAEVPAGTSYEAVQVAALSGWDADSSPVAKAFGSRWLREGRSAILFVPSVLSPTDRNVLINPLHPDAKGIEAGLETPAGPLGPPPPAQPDVNRRPDGARRSRAIAGSRCARQRESAVPTGAARRRPART